MLEISRQESVREMERVENDEAVIGSAPRNQSVGKGIVDHLISLENKRSNNVVYRVVALHPISFSEGTDDLQTKKKKAGESGGEGI